MTALQSTPPKRQTRSGSLGTQVAAQIRDAIMRGSLDLGESLSEDSLADALQVSRTPVREALRQLHAQGLVEIRPKSGARVFTLTEDRLVELIEFRVTLERQAADWAFTRNRLETAAAMSAAIKLMEPAIEAQDMRAFGHADTLFHQAFVENCDNSYLQSAFAMNLSQVAALRTHLAVHLEGEWQHAYSDHCEMRDMFQSGEREGLTELLTSHISRSRGNYIKVLQARYSAQQESKVDVLKRALGA